MSCTGLLAIITIIGALLLIAVWALGDIMTKQNAEAQMRGTISDTRMATTAAGNMTSGMSMKPGQNITSSINLMNIIHEAIGSKVNISLSDAATAAEGIGNNSNAVAAYLREENGYLVYNIMLADPSMNFSKVIVDPGNGHLLFSKQLTKESMMKDEMERHHKMMSMMMGGGHDMMGGPQQGGGMMMGPGTMGQGMMSQGQGQGGGMMMGGERNMMGPGMMGHQQGRGMMMGPMTAQAEQTDNATSTNATSVLPTTNATTDVTTPAAVVSTSEPSATTISMVQGSQSPNNPEFYVPTKITVKPGGTITWKNDDMAIHTATSGQDVTPDGKFDTGFVSPKQSSKPIAMPTQPGEYPYFCTLHPWMIGTVTVE